MKKIFGAFAVALMASPVFAANFIVPGNPAYEPFANATANSGTSYAIGSALPGQTNAQGLAWVLAGGNSNLQTIVSGTLSYPDLLADSGNSVSIGGPTTGNFSRWDFNSSFSGSSNQTIYYSMLLNVTNLGTLGSGIFLAGFNNSVGAQGSVPTTIGARLYFRTNGGGGYNIGINKADGTAGDIVWDSTNCTLNTTYFVVGAYTFSGTPTAASDLVSLWINPATNTFGGSAPAADVTTTNGANITAGASESIASFLLRQNIATAPYTQIAELSVGVTWADITPLPSGSLAPVFSNLHSTNTTFDTAVVLTGTLSAPGPVYPTNGETVTASVNGIQLPGTINDSTGDFSINYNPGSTPVSPTPYTVTYQYGGSSVLGPATDTSTTLTITNPLPVVLNGSRPFDGTSTVAAGTLYVSNAAGSDVVTVASGTGTLAGSAAGVQGITSFGSLTLGGANSNNYTLTGASGSVTIVTNPLQAGHAIFEPFNDSTASNGTSYANGANLAGQTNAQGFAWFAAGSGGGGEPMIQSGPLTVPGLIAVSTNSVTYGGVAGISTRLDLAPAGSSSTFIGNAGVTLYYSMAFQVNILGGLTSTNPAFICGFNNSAGAQTGQPSVVGARIYARLDGSGYDLGIDKNNATTTNVVWNTNTLTVGTTYFIVGAYSFSGTPAASNDTVSLWINPPTNTFGGSAPPPDVSSSVGNNLGTTSLTDEIASFILREASALEPAVMTVDDVSVGVTWADVTPTGNTSTQLSAFPILSQSTDITKSNFILTWQSVSGSHYQVIGSPTVSAARSGWTNVGSQITATGATTSATNPITATKNFYGVIGH
jgi:hypothetical protein